MLSVLRFTVERSRVAELMEIGARIDQSEPGAVERRKRGDGFIVVIEDSDLWDRHLDEIADFASVHEATIEAAAALGARVTFDVAVDPEDQAAQKHALLLVARAPLLATLGARGIDLEISIYRPALATDPP